MRWFIVTLLATYGFVFARKADGNERMWGNRGVLITAALPEDRPVSCSLGGDRVLTAYTEVDSNGFLRVAVQAIDYDRNLAFEPHPLYVSPREGNVTRHALFIKPTPEGGAIVAWLDSVGRDQYNLYAQKLNAFLNPVWDEGGVLLYHRWEYYFSGLDAPIFACEDGGILALEQRRSTDIRRANNYQVLAKKIDSNGRLDEGWPEAGREVFADAILPTINEEPGVGMWIGGFVNGEPDRYLVNLFEEDGSFRYEEPLEPPLPDDEEGVVQVESLEPDLQGGFYLFLLGFGFNGNESTNGFQHYTAAGEALMPDDQIWLNPYNDVSYGYRNLFTASEGGAVYSFGYNHNEGNGPVTTTVNCFRVNDGGVEPVWEESLVLEDLWVEPQYEPSNDQLVVRISHVVWTGEGNRRSWRLSHAEANKLNERGRLIFALDSLPCGLYQPVLPGVEDDFFTIIPEDGQIRLGLYDTDGEPIWANDERATIEHQDIGGQIIERQVLEGENVRLIEQIDKTNRYRFLSSDGSLSNPVTFLNETLNLSVTSGGSFCAALQENGHALSRFVILDNENQLHPDEPLSLVEQIGGGFQGIFTDSIGGCFVSFYTGAGVILRNGLIHLNQECEVVGETLWPFEGPMARGVGLVTSGEGGEWIIGKRGNESLAIQKISPEGELSWGGGRELQWRCSVFHRWSLIADRDQYLTLLAPRLAMQEDSLTILAMRYDTEGQPEWQQVVSAFEPDVGIATGGRNMLFWTEAGRSDGGIWVVAWVHEAGDFQSSAVRLQLLFSDGRRGLGGGGVVLPHVSNSHEPKIISDNENGAWIFLSTHNDGADRMRVLHFDADGQLTSDGGMAGTAVLTGDLEGSDYESPLQPWIYEDGSVGVVARREDAPNANFAQRIGPDAVSVKNRSDGIPSGLALKSVYPNPTNGALIIEYSVDQRGLVEIVLNDLMGRQIRQLLKEVVNEGKQSVQADLSDVSSGIYYVNYSSGGIRQEKIVVYVK